MLAGTIFAYLRVKQITSYYFLKTVYNTFFWSITKYDHVSYLSYMNDIIKNVKNVNLIKKCLKTISFRYVAVWFAYRTISYLLP